ncbi:MAG: hypothetical protein C5B58_00765 [Acidobacteria bacterium]|nr:MAG: hypothetical protein C5B58_00765 [Acidobacteriota bacterium]
MPRNVLLIAIRLIVSLNLLFAAVALKFAGNPLSIEAFTRMSHAVHGLISEPVFRIGSGIVETSLALLFLIPKSARLAAALIVLWMSGALLSHILVLGYGVFFLDALVVFLLPCLYLVVTRNRSAQFLASTPAL